eukprot:278802-Pelagomonas_calceolata.AAC.3
MVLNANRDESAVLIMAHTPEARSSADAKDCPGPFLAISRRSEPKGEGVGSSRSENAAMAVQPITIDALRQHQLPGFAAYTGTDKYAKSNDFSRALSLFLYKMASIPAAEISAGEPAFIHLDVAISEALGEQQR